MANVLCVLYEDPAEGYPPPYPRDDVPQIDRYPGGQTTPSPERLDFRPGELLGCVSGELGLRPGATGLAEQDSNSLRRPPAPNTQWPNRSLGFGTSDTAGREQQAASPHQERRHATRADQLTPQRARVSVPRTRRRIDVTTSRVPAASRWWLSDLGQLQRPAVDVQLGLKARGLRELNNPGPHPPQAPDRRHRLRVACARQANWRRVTRPSSRLRPRRSAVWRPRRRRYSGLHRSA